MDEDFWNDTGLVGRGNATKASLEAGATKMGSSTQKAVIRGGWKTKQRKACRWQGMKHAM